MSEPLCPANYFGQGEDAALEPDKIAEFNKLWNEWEEAHPDDPTGEIALAAYKQRNRIPSEQKIPEVEIDPTIILSGKIHLEITEDRIDKLKKYARIHRRRPRDIVNGWIDQFCKL